MTIKILSNFFTSALKFLQPIGITGGIIATIFSGNILFGVVISIFAISYVFSFIPLRKNKETVEIDDSTSNKFKSYLEELEGHLDTSVRGKMQIIPVLTEQLQAVINQTDEAAGGLTEAFIGISRQAKKQLQAVQGLFGNISEQSTNSNILSQTQENLQEIQNNFLTLTSFFDKSILMISEVVEQLSKVDAFALEIEKIGKITNILALNASIEAAHSGEAGNGFKVIASEINTLSKGSNNSIKKITEITENLTSKVNAIKRELESVLNHSKSVGVQTDGLFRLITDKINATLQDTAEQINMIAHDAESLTKEISKAVVSIQFQDITRQRIEHVISPLAMLNSDVIETIDKLIKKELDFSQDRENPLTDSLMKQYTMESEREILKKLNIQ